MTGKTFPRDIYDLYYGRSDQKYVGFGEATRWTKQQVADFDNRNRELDRLSRSIRDILQKRDALIVCQHYLTCYLRHGPFALIDNDNHPYDTALPPSRPDKDNEVTELRDRLGWLERDRCLEHMKVLILSQLSLTVRQKRVDFTGTSWWDGQRRLMYRVHRIGSHTFYKDDVGFCCPRWLRYRKVERPSKQDFCLHTGGAHVSPEGAFETPYISMTSSPLRALRLVEKEGMSEADVFVIDVLKLQATSIRIEPTTTLAHQYEITYKGPRSHDRAHYITESHWIAEYWIPADCIVTKMPLCQFKQFCGEKGILKGTKYPVCDLWRAYDSLMAYIVVDYPNGPLDQDFLELEDFEETPIPDNQIS